MSESADGAIVSDTRQNVGSFAASRAAAAPPAGGVNEPAATATADVTLVFGNVSELARRSQAVADTDPVSAARTTAPDMLNRPGTANASGLGLTGWGLDRTRTP